VSQPESRELIANSSWPQKILVKKMNDQTVAAKDIGGGIVGTLVRFSWRCSACVSGLVALVAGALYWKVSCDKLCTKFKISKLYILQHETRRMKTPIFGLMKSSSDNATLSNFLCDMMSSSHTPQQLSFAARLVTILSKNWRCPTTSISKSTEISITIRTRCTF